MEAARRAPHRHAQLAYDYGLFAPGDATTPKVCRDFVRAVLLTLDREPLVMPATLCTSELVTNVHLHTKGTAMLRVQLTPVRLRVSVYDESRPHAAYRATRGVLARAAERRQALLCGGQRVQGRAWEVPVQEEEFGHARGVTEATVNTGISLVRPARAQQCRPVGGVRRVQHPYGQQPYGQQPYGHVDPLQAPAQDHETPAVVPAHRRVGEAEEESRPAPYQLQVRVRARPARRKGRCGGRRISWGMRSKRGARTA